MNKTIKSIVAGIVVLVVGFILGSLGGSNTKSDAQLGGVTYDASRLVGDVYQGINGSLVMQNGSIVGTSTGAIVASKRAVFDNGILASAVYASSTATTTTLLAASITDISSMLLTDSTAISLTLPASSTLTSFAPLAGDNRRISIVNQGTGIVTFVAGTGTLLTSASSTKTVPVSGTAFLDCTRKTNTDIVCQITPGM